MTAREKALSLHAQGYNCAQSVLMAEGAYTGLEEKQAADTAVGFGGGARCGELCGAISGAIMAAGLHYGAENRPKADAFDRALTAAFREKFGALRCADLNAARIPCDELIAFAAEKTEALLAE